MAKEMSVHACGRQEAHRSRQKDVQGTGIARTSFQQIPFRAILEHEPRRNRYDDRPWILCDRRDEWQIDIISHSILQCIVRLSCRQSGLGIMVYVLHH